MTPINDSVSVTGLPQVQVKSLGRTLPPADPKAAELRRLRRATGEFESLFLSQLLSAMQRTTGRSESRNTFGGEIMSGMAQEKMAEELARQGGVGLGNLLYERLKARVVADVKAPVQPAPIPTGQGRRAIPLPRGGKLIPLPGAQSNKSNESPIRTKWH